ncbi:hypothetical protein [Helicobacter trogontum]|uniref:Uncharacterized protein n=1 Tax=Helicobacter trogontum TaxID=50960 RepID=A0A4U8TAU2_9HELI|nr:hypothetical protein [Helicobacter trogontum]TLD96278.1 hypothetical protein LS80_008645 [Helicobacter trogontum]
MRNLTKLICGAFILYTTSYADGLKECKGKEDKIKGCIEIRYNEEDLGEGTIVKERYETPYKNGVKEGIERI